MRKNEIYLDEMTDLIENISYKVSEKNKYDCGVDQPKHFSWFHIWWSIDGIFSDTTAVLEYADAEDFQQELINKVRMFFTPDTLQYIREGKIKNFGMQIGPHTPAHDDLNEELGIEVNYEQ
jgi:hypothetical protein